MLYHIATYEQRLGRPMLTSLVLKASGLLGDGFFELAAQFGRDVSGNNKMWPQELERVGEFWSRALDPSAVVRDRHGPTLAWDPTVLGDTRALATFDEINVGSDATTRNCHPERRQFGARQARRPTNSEESSPHWRRPRMLGAVFVTPLQRTRQPQLR